MKKIAICLPGSLRSIEFCYKNFIENIIFPNQDIFALTLFYYLPEDANSQKIYVLKEIMNLNPEIKINKDPELIIPNCNFKGRQVKVDNCSQQGIKGWLYQIQGMEESYNMVKDYEKNHKINFDYIARVRSDVMFLQPVKFINLINNDITIPYFHKWFGLNDRFAFGNSKSMSVYMKMYSNLYKYCETECLNITNAEWYCKFNLDKENIKYFENKEILFNRIRMDNKISPDAKIGTELSPRTGSFKI